MHTKCACAVPPLNRVFLPGMESSFEGRENGVCSCTPENVLRAFTDANLSCNFRVLGSQLGLDPPDLNEIESAPYDQRLMRLLLKCSQRRTDPEFTWSWIAGILRKPALREYSVARHIDQHYVRRNSSISTLSSLSSSTSSTEPLLLSPVHRDSGMNRLLFYMFTSIVCMHYNECVAVWCDCML